MFILHDSARKIVVLQEYAYSNKNFAESANFEPGYLDEDSVKSYETLPNNEWRDC